MSSVPAAVAAAAAATAVTMSVVKRRMAGLRALTAVKESRTLYTDEAVRSVGEVALQSQYVYRQSFASRLKRCNSRFYWLKLLYEMTTFTLLTALTSIIFTHFHVYLQRLNVGVRGVAH